MRAAVLWTCILLAGCAKNPTGVVSAPAARAWTGPYVGASEQGDLVIDVVQTGSELRGEVVFGAPEPHYFHVVGSLVADSLRLSLDPSLGPYLFTFEIAARVRSDGMLEGTMALSYTGLVADFGCRPIPRLRTTTAFSIAVPYLVKALAYDGHDLWLSTVGDDYVRMTTAGAVRDTVVIFYRPNTHWTSSALTSDGTLLWGFLPGTVMSPSGSTEYADIVSFSTAGRSPDSFRLWHRPAGLAFDGTEFWSLDSHASKLYRFNHSGTVIDSTHIAVPDAIQLVHDGGHFWTLGWYLKRLYQCDASGEITAIGDLPDQGTGSLQGGLAVSATHVWYAEGPFTFSRIHGLTVQ